MSPAASATPPAVNRSGAAGAIQDPTAEEILASIRRIIAEDSVAIPDPRRDAERARDHVIEAVEWWNTTRTDPAHAHAHADAAEMLAVAFARYNTACEAIGPANARG